MLEYRPQVMSDKLQDALLEESIYIFREVAGQFERPALLFSGGKDSIMMAYLAKMAFAPAPIPFPFLHIDTGHNFKETIEFRDWLAQELGVQMLVRYVEDSIKSGASQEETGPYPSRNSIQSITLKAALAELKIDCAIGGARRDEEKARAKERFFSHRDAFSQWDPKSQRPEVWRHFNGAKAPGEHFRVFPLSNWTELDIWEFIVQHDIPLPDLYFAKEREVFEKDGMLMAITEFLTPQLGESIEKRIVRFRTVGDATCTGAFLSGASNRVEVLEEVRTLRVSERAGRADDKRSESAMEDRKKQGYF